MAGRLIVVPIELEPKPAVVNFEVPSGARIEIDGRAVRKNQASVLAGQHFVTISKRGHKPVSRELDLSRGEKTTVAVSLQNTGQRKASYYVLGTAATILLASGVTGALALNAQSAAEDIQEEITDGNNIDEDDIDEHNDAIDRRDTYRTVSYVLVGTAILTAAVGSVLYWADNPRIEAPAQKPRIVPTVTGDGLGAVLTGRFD